MVCTSKACGSLGLGLKELLLVMVGGNRFVVVWLLRDKRMVDGWQSGSFSKDMAKTLRMNSINKAVCEQRMSE